MNKINDLHIWVYREVYSLYHKPMLKNNYSQDKIKQTIKGILEEDYGNLLTFKLYAKLNVIDAGQRVLRLSKKLNKPLSELPPIPEEATFFPDLRCPKRSKDQDDKELFYPVETPSQFISQ